MRRTLTDLDNVLAITYQHPSQHDPIYLELALPRLGFGVNRTQPHRIIPLIVYRTQEIYCGLPHQWDYPQPGHINADIIYDHGGRRLGFLAQEISTDEMLISNSFHWPDPPPIQGFHIPTVYWPSILADIRTVDAVADNGIVILEQLRRRLTPMPSMVAASKTVPLAVTLKQPRHHS